METLRCEPEGFWDKYWNSKYEIVSNEDNILIIKLFRSLASGVRYTIGSANIVNGILHLICETQTSENIEFELLPWELTYTIEHSNNLNLDTIYFSNEKIGEINS